MASDKTTAILVVGGIAVVGVLAYVAYKFLKPIAGAAKKTADVVGGINDWFAGAGKQITDFFGGVESSTTGAVGTGVNVGIAEWAMFGDWLTGQHNQHVQQPGRAFTPAQQAYEVQHSYEVLGGVAPSDSPDVVAYKIAQAKVDQAQQIARGGQGFFGGL